MSQLELVKLRKQLKDILESGIIKPAKLPYGALVLFHKKADGSLHICCDYRVLNKITAKNKYPIPLAVDCFDRLSRVKYFEFLVMPFGPTNAPATFNTLMKQVLLGFLMNLWWCTWTIL
ncbi:UNVERIFIED_CONTAM: hypothetical protein Slati_4605300 [Sesamum latifolium]|uniref:Reverse transcriptase n=1 Tax=Sesamum latifolium TaxID=2727402 RepID=A0AAW2S432_9LAMI